MMKSYCERSLRITFVALLVALFWFLKGAYGQNGSARVQVFMSNQGFEMHVDTLWTTGLDNLQERIDSLVQSLELGMNFQGLPYLDGLNGSLPNLDSILGQGNLGQISQVWINGTDTVIQDIDSVMNLSATILFSDSLPGFGNPCPGLLPDSLNLSGFLQQVLNDTVLMDYDTIITQTIRINAPCPGGVGDVVDLGDSTEMIHYTFPAANTVVIIHQGDSVVQGDSVSTRVRRALRPVTGSNHGSGQGSRKVQVRVVKVIMEETGTDKSASPAFEPPLNSKKPLRISELNFFPNPGNGLFDLRFHLDTHGDTRILIHDASGREVYSEVITDFSGDYSGVINLTDQPGGTYYLTIEQGRARISKKLIIQ